MKPSIRNTGLAVILALVGCGPENSELEKAVISASPDSLTNPHREAPTEIPQVGGLYATKGDDGKYKINKVLAADDQAVHLRLYKDTFDDLPGADFSSADHDYILGHYPITLAGFAQEDRQLIKVEEVAESELEGYRFYLRSQVGK